MRKIIVGAAFVSLDGVMQAPGGRTEDPTGGVKYSGRQPPYADEAIGNTVGELFNRSFDLLLGADLRHLCCLLAICRGQREADGRDV